MDPEGGNGVTEGSGYLMLTTRESSNLGKVLGLAKKKEGRELDAAWEKGGVVRREGSPALACPLSPARTLPGSPGVAATREAQPRIAFLPGRAAWPAAPAPEIGPGWSGGEGRRGRPGSPRHQAVGPLAPDRDLSAQTKKERQAEAETQARRWGGLGWRSEGWRCTQEVAKAGTQARGPRRRGGL